MKFGFRKKMTTTVIAQIVTVLATIAAVFGLDITPEQQAAIIVVGGLVYSIIQGTFNIGQGIADKGKETGKTLLIFLIAGSLVVIGLPAYAQPEGPESITTEDCCGDLEACVQLMDECTGADCPPVIECPAIPECPDCESVWKILIKDRTLQAGLVASALALIGGIVTIFLVPK